MNVGIIGCGKITQVRHAPEYAAHPDCRILKVFDLNQDRASEVASRFGAECANSYEEILQDDRIDAVSICVINKKHAAFSIKALQAGKHVICEKPMAITLEECNQMVREAKKNDRRLLIAQNQRLLKSHQLARQMIREGKIGKILTFRFTFSHSGPEKWSVDQGNGTWFFKKDVAAFGVLNDLGVHKIDLMQYILDDTADLVLACTDTLDKRCEDGRLIEVEDNVICLIRMKNHTMGSVVASWTNYGEEDNSTVIYGSEGLIRIYADPDYSVVLERRCGERIYMKLDEIQSNHTQHSSGIIEEFYDAVVHNKESILDCEKILLSMKTAFACVKSAKTNQWEKVPN